MKLTLNGLAVTVDEREVARIVQERITSRPFAPPLTIEQPALNDGEHYAGILLGKDGAPSHHVILLPGDRDDGPWQNAVDWAASIGGTLPTRREQALLYANLPEQFKSEWYWSCEQLAAVSGYAWLQAFGNGYQDFYHESDCNRARAVRRLTI